MTLALPDRPWAEDEDLLGVSAPLADKMALTLCRARPGAAEDCAWYHGFWQYLRLFGLAATPYRDGAFFDATLGALARDGGFPRILVSGTADYAMPAVVLRAYRGAGAEPEITAVDVCETPLFLCRWYAQSVAAALRTHATDILDWTPDAPFDAICTHSFVARFPPALRQPVLSKWRNLLRPGGKVVTTTRVDPSWTQDRARSTPDQVRAFRDRVFQEASKRRERLGLDPEEMARRAEAYAARRRSYSPTSREEVAGLFETNGFVLDRLDLVELPAGLSARRSGPGARRNVTYAEIVATRI